MRLETKFYWKYLVTTYISVRDNKKDLFFNKGYFSVSHDYID